MPDNVPVLQVVLICFHQLYVITELKIVEKIIDFVVTEIES
jgi:hypothetical protein